MDSLPISLSDPGLVSLRFSSPEENKHLGLKKDILKDQ